MPVHLFVLEIQRNQTSKTKWQTHLVLFYRKREHKKSMLLTNLCMINLKFKQLDRIDVYASN